MKDALKKLNLAYKPPTAKVVGNRLLFSVYQSLKIKVDAYISTISYINFISDESTNISGSRIFNVFLHTESGALHYLSNDKYW